MPRCASALAVSLTGYLITIATLVAGCAQATTLAPATASRGVPARYVLPSGMRLIVQEHRASDVVSLQLWVGVGGRDEAPDERGFSHFVEHMLFKGTDTLPAGFVDREVEGVGGRTNAGTSWDYTFYYMLLPASRAVRGIEVLSDVAFNSSFEPAEITREREVVFEEVRLGEDNPRSFLIRRLYETAFPGHPYGLPVLGDVGVLGAATRETLRGYYKRHYLPENMTLVVVGAVDPEMVRATFERAFARVPAHGYRREPVPAPADLDGSQRRQVGRPERLASMGLAWHAPALGQPDMYAVDLLAQILGGSGTSRLNQSLRERARVVSSIRAGYSALQGAGLVVVTAQCEPDNVARAEEATLAEIKRIQDEGVTEDERDRAVTAAEAQHAFSIETAEGMAQAYGSAETLWTLDGELRYLSRIRSVTRKQIQQAAQRYLARPHAALSLVPRDRAAR